VMGVHPTRRMNEAPSRKGGPEQKKEKRKRGGKKKGKNNSLQKKGVHEGPAMSGRRGVKNRGGLRGQCPEKNQKRQQRTKKIGGGGVEGGDRNVKKAFC